MADKNQENAAEVAAAAASEDKSSSSSGMNILYIVLAVIAALVVIYLLFTHVGPAVMDILMNSFGSSGPEYQLSQAFGIVN